MSNTFFINCRRYGLKKSGTYMLTPLMLLRFCHILRLILFTNLRMNTNEKCHGLDVAWHLYELVQFDATRYSPILTCIF